jgi:hypothetical protein
MPIQRELLQLGLLMLPLLRRARARAVTQLGANLTASPGTLSRVTVQVFGEAYLDGVDAAIAVFGSRLGVTRASVQNELTRALTERAAVAIGTARTRLLAQLDELASDQLTVAEVTARAAASAQQMVWTGQDQEAQVIGRLAEVEWKTWVRAFARDEQRDHHDDLNGRSIPVDDLFRYALPGGGTAEVYGPRDWDALPEPSEWMNCGHALDFRREITAEEAEETLRSPGSVVIGPERVRTTESEQRAAALARLGP